MEDKVGPVKVLGPGGDTSDVTLQPVPIEPGVWRSTVDVKLPGLYKVETAGPSSTLTAVANAGIEDPREMSEVTATDQKMKPIADATGGGVFWTKSTGLVGTCNRRRRSAYFDDVVCQGHGRLRLARPQGSSGVPDARREVDADVHRVRGAVGAIGADRIGVVARRTLAHASSPDRRIAGGRDFRAEPYRENR